MIDVKSFYPLRDRVLVLPIEGPSETEGGIVLPDSVKEGRHVTGLVVAVGPGKVSMSGVRLEPQVKPGDKVLFHLDLGVEVLVGGKKHRVVAEEDILGVLETK